MSTTVICLIIILCLIVHHLLYHHSINSYLAINKYEDKRDYFLRSYKVNKYLDLATILIIIELLLFLVFSSYFVYNWLVFKTDKNVDFWYSIFLGHIIDTFLISFSVIFVVIELISIIRLIIRIYHKKKYLNNLNEDINIIESNSSLDDCFKEYQSKDNYLINKPSNYYGPSFISDNYLYLRYPHHIINRLAINNIEIQNHHLILTINNNETIKIFFLSKDKLNETYQYLKNK